MPKQKSWDEQDPGANMLSRRHHSATTGAYSSSYYQSFQSHSYDHDSWSRTLLTFAKRLFHRPFVLLWWIIAALLIYLCLRIPHEKSVSKTSRSQYPPPFIYDFVEYQDTTQSTDYQLLQKLLYTQNEAAADKHIISTNQEIAMRRQGHSAQEILELSQQTELPRSTVTAIIYYANNEHSSTQFKTIVSQSVNVNEVWIVCTADNIKNAQQQLREDKSKIKYILGDRNDWFHLSVQPSTDFVWLIDHDIVPGERYLELLLRLSETEQYNNALLGSQGFSLSLTKNGPHCIYDGERSHTVDVVLGQWLLRRSWLTHINPTLTIPPRPSLLGYQISKIASQYIGAPSVYVPTSDLGQDYSLSGVDTSLCDRVLQHLRAATENGTAWQELAVQDDTAGAKIAFMVDDIHLLDAYMPLVCKFVQKDVAVNLVSIEHGQGLPLSEAIDHLRRKEPECARNIIGHSLEIESENAAGLSAQAMHDLARFLSSIRPVVTIHGIADESTTKGIELAAKVAKNVVINLPGREVPHGLWMAEVPLEALKEWHTFTVKLVVVTDRKPHSLARLVRSAARAHLLGDKVDLSVIMEQSSDRVTRAFVNSLPWPYGKKELRHRVSKVNHMPVYVESWYPSSNDEYAIILDEGLELSPNFYEWTKYAILKYRYSPGYARENTPMFGISLSTPRLVESDPNGRRLFNPAYQLESYGYHARTPFLMQSPTTSGTLYFPEYWREFHDYITARITDISRKQLQNITLPNIRSSQWTNSWRRYLDELIYMRGYVMLYPNFPNYASLSTNHFELGEHVMEDYSQVASVFRVPLLETDSVLSLLPDYQLPEWDELPILDIWGNVEALDTLWERGAKLQQDVSACAPQPMEKHLHDPSDLLCPFAKLVTIPVNSEEDPVPDFSTRHVVLPTEA